MADSFDFIKDHVEYVEKLRELEKMNSQVELIKSSRQVIVDTTFDLELAKKQWQANIDLKSGEALRESLEARMVPYLAYLNEISRLMEEQGIMVGVEVSYRTETFRSNEKDAYSVSCNALGKLTKTSDCILLATPECLVKFSVEGLDRALHFYAYPALDGMYCFFNRKGVCYSFEHFKWVVTRHVMHG